MEEHQVRYPRDEYLAVLKRILSFEEVCFERKTIAWPGYAPDHKIDPDARETKRRAFRQELESARKLLLECYSGQHQKIAEALKSRCNEIDEIISELHKAFTETWPGRAEQIRRLEEMIEAENG